jgi:hypothetical protein
VTDPHDVRDRSGRLVRLWISVLLGLVGSFAITIILPTRDHFPQMAGSCGFSHPQQGWIVQGGDPVLMLAGALGITIAIYTMWNYRVRSVAKSLRMHALLPRAVARLDR